MCIYTVKKTKIKKKKSCTPPNVSKFDVSGVEDAAKNTKDLGMLCYIHVDDSVFFR